MISQTLARRNYFPRKGEGRGGAAEQTAPRSQLDIYYISIRMGNLDLLRGFDTEHLFAFGGRVLGF